LQKATLQLLIDRQLFLQEFERRGFQLESQTVADAVDEQIKAQYGDRAKFTEALSKRGLTLAAYEQTVREKIIVSAMQSFIAKDATSALTRQGALETWLTDARTKARIKYKP
jgi:SurA N-terminal domain.